MDIGANGEDMDALTAFLRAELDRSDAEMRAIHTRSRASFAAWAQGVLRPLASQLGLSIGFLVGLAQASFESISDGFRGGWREGLSRGRGDARHG